jgi:hypothetical protein
MSVITTGLTVTSTFGSWYFDALPIRADQASVNQFCTQNGYTSGGTFTSDSQRSSNDGGRIMNYYGQVAIGATVASGVTYQTCWLNLFGYDGIVTSITEP